MGKNTYKLYAVPSNEWTAEMDISHDYVKVYGETVYFMSRKKETAELITSPPQAIGDWLTACESTLLMQSNNKKNARNFEKAKKQLGEDFMRELDKALMRAKQSASRNQ